MVTDVYGTYHDYHFVMHINAKSLCCTSESNITLYFKYASIKKEIQSQIKPKRKKVLIYLKISSKIITIKEAYYLCKNRPDD